MGVLRTARAPVPRKVYIAAQVVRGHRARWWFAAPSAGSAIKWRNDEVKEKRRTARSVEAPGFVDGIRISTDRMRLETQPP
jgi:hypothetical protein